MSVYFNWSPYFYFEIKVFLQGKKCEFFGEHFNKKNEGAIIESDFKEREGKPEVQGVL